MRNSQKSKDTWKFLSLSGEVVEPLNSRILETGILEFGGIRILALEAIPNPSFAPGPVNYQAEHLEFCMAQRDIDIFLSHSPGFSGHIHEYKKEQAKGITLIRLGSVHNSTQFYDMIEL